ncbi:MAG: hypothetical protein PHO14_04695, partial [Kiritimatiellae bacterium]|nr:hypothetical protein [Kiritimatiellia bacterium]
MVKLSKKSPPKSAKRSARRRRRRELSAWKRFRLQGWRKKLHSSRPDHPPAEEMAMRAELFGVSQLENYA